MTVDAGTLAAILVMAAATAFNRAGGFWLMRLVPVTPRVRRVLDCLPGAVLVALLVPSAVQGAVKGDMGMLGGLAAALVVTRLTRSDLLAVVVAMAVAAGIRAFWG